MSPTTAPAPPASSSVGSWFERACDLVSEESDCDYDSDSSRSNLLSRRITSSGVNEGDDGEADIESDGGDATGSPYLALPAASKRKENVPAKPSSAGGLRTLLLKKGLGVQGKSASGSPPPQTLKQRRAHNIQSLDIASLSISG